MIIQEIHYHNIMLLTIPMTTTYSLFNTLRIPGQVIVYDKRTELQVNTFRSGFCSNHDMPFFTEIINDSRAHIRST